MLILMNLRNTIIETMIDRMYFSTFPFYSNVINTRKIHCTVFVPNKLINIHKFMNRMCDFIHFIKCLIISAMYINRNLI